MTCSPSRSTSRQRRSGRTGGAWGARAACLDEHLVQRRQSGKSFRVERPAQPDIQVTDRTLLAVEGGFADGVSSRAKAGREGAGDGGGAPSAASPVSSSPRSASSLATWPRRRLPQPRRPPWTTATASQASRWPPPAAQPRRSSPPDRPGGASSSSPPPPSPSPSSSACSSANCGTGAHTTPWPTKSGWSGRSVRSQSWGLPGGWPLPR